MRLYSWDIAPNPRRVRIYLAEKGLDVPTEDVGVPGKPVLRPDFLAKFGHWRVPLLELDDGACIVDRLRGADAANPGTGRTRRRAHEAVLRKIRRAA